MESLWHGAWLDYTVNGLVVGNIYALLAVGLALIFDVSHLINFAHGSVYTVGAFLGWFAITHLHAPLWATILLVIVGSALLGMGIAMVAEGGLALLGASVEAPQATWGTMINLGRADMRDAPFIMFFPIKLISKVVNIKSARLYPVILIMCIVGAYATRSGVMFDVWSLLIFGVLGYLMSKIGLPTAPFLIGFILGGDLETYFLEAVRGNNYSLAPFFTRPIAIVIWVLIVIFLGYSIWDNAKGKTMEKAGMKD